jgi:hypothetical protein
MVYNFNFWYTKSPIFCTTGLIFLVFFAKFPMQILGLRISRLLPNIPRLLPRLLLCLPPLLSGDDAHTLSGFVLS